MVSYGEVRRWQPEPLHQSVRQLNELCTNLVGLSDEMGDAGKTNRWHGQAAQGAANHLRGVFTGLEDLISEVGAMRAAMGETADAITGLMHGVAEAEGLATRNYLRIEDNGILLDQAGFTFPSAEAKDAWEADRERVKAELLDRVKEIIRRADDIDNDLSTVVSRCLERGGVGTRSYESLTEAARAGGDAGHLSMLEPPPGGTAAANAAWWSTLGEGERNWVMANRPDLIGNLDGVPAHYRHLANVARIAGEGARLQSERDAKAAEVKKWEDPGHQSTPDAVQKYWNLKAELEALDDKLAALGNVEKTLAQGERQLLVLDTTGDRVKAAIAIGNLDTADHVAVFTPGMNSTVEDSMRGYDNDMRELRAKSEEELRIAGRQDETVAVVTWLNYEPPNLDPDKDPLGALSDEKAYQGAAKLAPFLEGVNTSRPDDPHLTALGHSYGSLTTGIALRDHATGVDELAVFGSPGLEVDNASQLRVPQGHTYNLEAEGDWFVADAGPLIHGTDAAELPGMRQLSTGEYTTPDGRHFDAAYGHSEYSRAGDKNTTSEWNLANIVAGTGIVH